MKNLKKLPTKQLEKFSNIFMQLGLVLVLFVVYVFLEHETEQKTAIVITEPETTPVYISPDETIIFKRKPKIEPKVELPKPTKVILDKVVKGDNNVTETIIDTEPIDEPKIIDINKVPEIKEIEPIDNDEHLFTLIEEAPVFKGCEGLSKKENKICFDKKMKQFVQRNFDIDLANELGLNSGKHKIQTQFIINKEGNVVDVKIRASHIKLKKETERLIKKIPKFTPGKQRNQAVKVRYILPITFSVN